MKNRKRIFFIFCIAIIFFMAFMLIPDEPEDGQQTVTQNPQTQTDATNETTENKPDVSQPAKTDEWDSNEFEEDKETEILGTFARKTEADTTVFIYFDREGVFLRETHKENDVKKELGRYSLSGTTLNIDGEEHAFDRDGDNIIIDGKMWEYLEGVILSVV